jgi:hypothetical protein
MPTTRPSSTLIFLSLALVLTTGCRSTSSGVGIALPSAGPMEAPVAEVQSVVGNPEVGINGRMGSWTEVGIGYRITPGVAIQTGFKERMTLKLPSGSILDIEPGSWVEAGFDADGTPTFKTLRGKITGTVEGGPVEFSKATGESILLTPKPGARLTVSFDDRPDSDAERLSQLGAPWWAYGDWSINRSGAQLPFVARNPVPPISTQIPEPSTVALGLLGGALLTFGRFRSRR